MNSRAEAFAAEPSTRGPLVARPPVWIYLIAVGCALLPMTGMKGPAFMGELARTASVWFFIPAGLLSFTQSPQGAGKAIAAFGTVFVLWILASAFINMDEILQVELRGRSGVSRLVTSTLVVIYGFMIAFSIAKVPVELVYKFVLLPVLCGILIATAVSVIEIAWWIVPTIRPFYQFVVELVRPGFPHLEFWGRLTSVGFEPHALGLWLGFAFPITLWGWSSDAGRRQRGLWGAGLLCVVLMLALSAGRAGMLTSAIVFAVWATAQVWRSLVPFPYPAKIALTGVAILFLGMLTFQLSQGASMGQSLIGGEISNLSRYAMNVSAYEMVPDAPIAGRGIGQYAFWSNRYIPPWGWSSYEVRAWLIDQRKGWPSTFSLPGRLLSELGIVGFFLWYAGLFTFLLRAMAVKPVTLNGSGLSSEGLLILLLAPFLFFSGLTNDTFAQGGFWVALGLCSLAFSGRRFAS